MYINPYDPCDCENLHCGCCSIYSFSEHYTRILRLYRPSRVFEWGSGLSTKMAIHEGAEIVTIEPSVQWAARLPLQHPKLAVLLTSVGSAAYLRLAGYEESDLFFVDGRRRAECLDVVWRQAKPKAVVCLHDAQRQRYSASLKQFENVVYLERGFAVASRSPLHSELLE